MSSRFKRAGGKVKEIYVVRREVKKSMRGGKEAGAQDAKRVADNVAHIQIFWLHMYNFLLREHLGKSSKQKRIFYAQANRKCYPPPSYG